MRFDAISKYQHNFIKKDFMFDYKYLLNSLCKNNEGFDAFDYFVKSILRYFSLQAGFVIRIDNENININSKNLSKEKIIKDIKVYRKLIENIDGGLVFSRDGDRIWKCRNCGHIVIGASAPEVCPVCAHPKAYFEIKAENY